MKNNTRPPQPAASSKPKRYKSVAALIVDTFKGPSLVRYIDNQMKHTIWVEDELAEAISIIRQMQNSVEGGHGYFEASKTAQKFLNKHPEQQDEE